ncbi:MAG: 3-deoxy-D-manno-octulosonic acid transferase [Alphaproteobacteria bacterium]|jgi:3-deoxy-D-manno-octulosonic-acid transferase|nr:3-deoxy-D-manno-octulosonic acid transferase [Alphaproteobacteria bacterium]
MLILYRCLTIAAGPIAGAVLRRRAAAGKEDPDRLAERLGHAVTPRPDGDLAWVHAASVGESLSVLPLVARLLRDQPSLHLLITTGTVTSARLLAERLPARAIHQYAPVDRPDAVRRFLDHWRPDLAIWVESELWPNLLGTSQARGVPCVLVQGRMSDRSFAAWRYARGLIRPLLRDFRLLLAQTDVDAERFRKLGGAQVMVTGTIKYASPPLPVAADHLAETKSAIGARPLWLAASIHPGEVDAVIAAHQTLGARFDGLLTIIVPRHPRRGPDIARQAAGAGLTPARRAAREAPSAATDLYIADTMGELGLFYRLCGIAFIGGSLIPHGGQNPIEPMQLGCAVIHGPSMYNFDEVVADLAAAGAARSIAEAGGLAVAVGALLAAPDARDALARAQRAVAETKAGVLDDVVAALAPLIPGHHARP